jgi:lipid A 4'-phosphatase
MALRLAWFAAAFLLLCGTPVVFPVIDLWASGLFYRHGAGFFLADWWGFRAAHDGLPYVVTAFILSVTTALGLALLRRRTVLGLEGKAAVFLLLALALGPGVTVNTIFKDHWGRARPVQITEFGGDKKFTRTFVPADQCARNCSFPAGDPSLGFYLASIALLAPLPVWRRRGIAGAIVLGAGLGIVRLAQGGHFLSDIIASGFLVFGVSWLLHRVLIVHDGLAALFGAFRQPSLTLKNFLGLTLVTAVLFFVSYALFDEALARYFYDSDPTLRSIFAIITRFGDSTIYLVPLALAILWSLWVRRALLAWRTAYIFAAIAIPGLLADILKPVFGRARPGLLFRDQLFGFTWSGPRADHWSFPSGHAITITALATALYAIYPPLWPAYVVAAVLVSASRIIIDAHYLSDVVVGIYVGFVATWAFAIVAKHNGIKLSLQQEKISDIP